MSTAIDMSKGIDDHSMLGSRLLKKQIKIIAVPARVSKAEELYLLLAKVRLRRTSRSAGPKGQSAPFPKRQLRWKTFEVLPRAFPQKAGATVWRVRRPRGGFKTRVTAYKPGIARL